MSNIALLKKRLLYRSGHRGTKEMDLLLGNFVKKFINKFNDKELRHLEDLLNIDDDALLHWYLNKKVQKKIPINKVTNLLKDFKI